MDPLSIASGCAGLTTAIGSLSMSIHRFVRTCREARGDLDSVSRELHSLRTILELIQEDASDASKPFPAKLNQHVSAIVVNCNLVVTEIQDCITNYGQDRLKSRMAWAINGQGDINKLRSSLEAHKTALEIALDMLALHLTKEIKHDTTELRNDTAAIKEDTAQILDEIARLQARLPPDAAAAASNDFILQRFFEEMIAYTEQALDAALSDADTSSSRALSIVEDPEERAGDLAEQHLQSSSTDTLHQYQPGEPPMSGRALAPVTEIIRPVETSNAQDSPPPTHALENGLTGIPYQHGKSPNSENAASSEGPYLPSLYLKTSHLVNASFEATSEVSSSTLTNEDHEARRHSIDRRQGTSAENPTRNTSIQHQGISSFEIQVHDELLLRVPSLTTHEFTYRRYSAITCSPGEFKGLNFIPRPLILKPPRQIEIVVLFTIHHDESIIRFRERWNFLVRSIVYLKENNRTSMDKESVPVEPWKHILVHVVCEDLLEGINPIIRGALYDMGILNKEHGHPEAANTEGKSVMRETVQAEIFEITVTTYARDLNDPYGSAMYRYIRTPPFQVILTAYRNNSSWILPVSEATAAQTGWYRPISALLKPRLIIEMPNPPRCTVADFLYEAWADKRDTPHLPAANGSVNISLGEYLELPLKSDLKVKLRGFAALAKRVLSRKEDSV